jgi:hypothetical protein
VHGIIGRVHVIEGRVSSRLCSFPFTWPTRELQLEPQFRNIAGVMSGAVG